MLARLLEAPRVQGVLAGCLRQDDYRLAATTLPLETLAVLSGLTRYGRNNITYVSGMGSFHKLVGAYSDMPCGDDPRRTPKALDRCESCFACHHNCPTGAIGEDRFLLHAETCLTYHNEAFDDFTEWIEPSWHHCPVGCMRCQPLCPGNEMFLNRYDDGAEFTESETALLIKRVPIVTLPTETAAKLRGLEINAEHLLLCRSLAVLGQATRAA